MSSGWCRSHRATEYQRTDYERIASRYDEDRQHSPTSADLGLTELFESGSDHVRLPDAGCSTRRDPAAADERWTFGPEPSEVSGFLTRRGLTLEADVGASDHRARHFGEAAARVSAYEFCQIAAAHLAGLRPKDRTSSRRREGPGVGDVDLRSGYSPGAIGRVVELHAAYYHGHWGFGAFFEAKVAAELAQFFGRYDPRRAGFWTASVSGRIEGSITIDGAHAAADGAHLRWFIVSDTLRGKGAGNRLIDAAVRFCRDKRYPRVYLWTFEGLHAARHLYEKAGFRLVEQHRGTQWGTEVTEQRFELRLTVSGR